MSQIEDAIYQQMKADGTADWINQTVKDAVEDKDPEAASTEAPVTDTDEVEDEDAAAAASEQEDATEESQETATAEETPADDAAEDAAAEEGELYLELDPETERLLNEKYGGDLNKMLRAATEAQSLIGRQGNELGELRDAMERLRAEVSAGVNRAQVEWPDEYTEPADAARAYRQIAEQAFAVDDEQSFAYALDAWNEIDPMGVQTFAMLMQTRIEQAEAQTGAPSASDTLAEGVGRLTEEIPQLSDTAFQAEVRKELEKFPTLLGTFMNEKAAPAERVAALAEAAKLVASRQADGDARQALRRVAVKTSEEARSKRAEARVASGGGRGKSTTPPDRQIMVGDTGQTVGEGELKARIKELTGMDVEVGRSVWKSNKG